MKAIEERRPEGALEAEMLRLGEAAVAAARVLALAAPEAKTLALEASAREVRLRSAAILAANASTIARLEWKLSAPPRRMAALPALRHREPASAVTFGRDS